MKTRLFVLILSLAAIACSKDKDPGFTSPEGTWTYNTPDGKIGVDFDLVKNGSTWDVVNQVIRVEGNPYNAEKIVTGINPPTLESIRINANDAAITYAYVMLFESGTVNADFTEIKVPDASYTWPFNKTNSLTDIVIKRK